MHVRSAWLATTGAVLVRPTLWLTALREARRMAPTGWWRRPPFLPLPDRAYLRFRATTMYGDPEHQPPPDDLVTWLRWCRSLERVNDT